jgi:hypothetical protein
LNAANGLLESIGRYVLRSQQQRSKRRRQRQRVERRDDRRGGDRDCELAIELPRDAGEERDRDEHRAEHEHDGDDWTCHLCHRCVRGRARVETFLHLPLDILDHDDGVVHDDTRRQHQPEQRQCVDRESKQQQRSKRPDDRDRHRDERDDARAPALQEHDDDQHNEQDGFEQRVHDRFDRVADEYRWIVGDLIGQSFRKAARQLLHRGANFIRQRERIGTGQLEHRNCDGR